MTRDCKVKANTTKHIKTRIKGKKTKAKREERDVLYKIMTIIEIGRIVDWSIGSLIHLHDWLIFNIHHDYEPIVFYLLSLFTDCF